MTEASIRDNAAASRFELDVLGETAFAEYEIADGVITFTHTVTPAALRGKGAASQLIGGALREARARGLKVRAVCSFVAAYLARHKEFADLIA